MTYSIALEKFTETYRDLEPLYRKHYAEMTDRLAKQGIVYNLYAPRLYEYEKACNGGWLLNFVLRDDGAVCGYCNVYVTNDMHNNDLIAQEDTLFVLQEHRNGIGKKLVQAVLAELKQREVKRLIVSAMTDLRVAKLWGRMGFKEAATQMIYTF
jgi:GNAT superfamily N-acetyltransferase